MPTICHDCDRGLITGNRVKRDDWGRRIQRSARGSGTRGILMIKTQSMFMVRRRVDS